MFVDVVSFDYRSRECLSHLKSILQFLLSIHRYLKESIILKNVLTSKIIVLQKCKSDLSTFNNALHFGLVYSVVNFSLSLK